MHACRSAAERGGALGEHASTAGRAAFGAQVDHDAEEQQPAYAYTLHHGCNCVWVLEVDADAALSSSADASEKLRRSEDDDVGVGGKEVSVDRGHVVGVRGCREGDEEVVVRVVRD